MLYRRIPKGETVVVEHNGERLTILVSRSSSGGVELGFENPAFRVLIDGVQDGVREGSDRPRKSG